MSEQNFLFYAFDGQGASPPRRNVLPPGYRSMLWRPASGGITPPGIPLLPFGVWWLLHVLHVFCSRDYALFLIYYAETLVHRAVITPAYLRFPFMERDDLQVGDTWTREDHRGKGLATFALSQIRGLDDRPGRRYWYVVEENNTVSIRVVEKAGFLKVGRGARYPRFGIRLLGAFKIDEDITSLCLPH